MELRTINRKYKSLKFIRKTNYNKNEYEELLKKEEYFKMKDITISYCEEFLHVLHSYIYLIKNIIPILLLLIILFFSFKLFIILLIITIISYFILLKKWKLIKKIYSFEITALNDFINEKYNTNVNVNFDNLGTLYQ
jgi:hypothetical protein